MRLAEKAGVEVIVKMGRTLFDPDEIVRKNNGKPTISITQLEKAAMKINNGNPEKPRDAPKSVPDPWDKDRMDLSSLKQESIEIKPDLNEGHRTQQDEQYSNLMGPTRDFAVPWQDIGIDLSQATTPHRGGEREALRILEECIKNEDFIGTFEKPNTSPADFEPQSTTLLSPHLHFGSLSVRKFWWDVQAVLNKRRKAKQPVSGVPTNLPGQLLFRDMYFAAQAPLGQAFSYIYGNEIARFIDWHLKTNPPSEDGVRDGSYEMDSPIAEEWFQRWREGRTGFPWIDALMRQLRLEGWIHHLGRHSVACFLTRGGAMCHGSGVQRCLRNC
jgi:cryptochrome